MLMGGEFAETFDAVLDRLELLEFLLGTYAPGTSELVSSVLWVQGSLLKYNRLTRSELGEIKVRRLSLSETFGWNRVVAWGLLCTVSDSCFVYGEDRNLRVCNRLFAYLGRALRTGEAYAVKRPRLSADEPAVSLAQSSLEVLLTQRVVELGGLIYRANEGVARLSRRHFAAIKSVMDHELSVVA